MRILHLIQRYAPALGGSETWCREVARRQAKWGDQVRVLTLDILDENEYWREPEAGARHFRPGHLDLIDGVEVRRFRRSLPVHTFHHAVLDRLLNRLLNVFFLGPHSRQMVAHLDAEVAWADLVHLHTLPYPHNWFGRRAARRAGRPVVITPHFHPGHQDYERRHQYSWLRRADAVITVSEEEKRILADRGIDTDRVTVTGNGLAESTVATPPREESRRHWRQALGLGEAGTVVACVARKHRDKGLEALIGAVGRLADEGRDIGLVVAGPSFAWFQHFLNSLPGGLRQRVVDRGVVGEEEKAEILAGADIFAMPSRFEAFGIVFLEAWAAGLPVIGGAHGAQPSVIGEGGQTVPFGDVAATAAALARYMDDPEAGIRAVQWGRRAIGERYNWDTIARQVGEVYRQVSPRRHLRLAYAANFYPPHFIGGAELALAAQVESLVARGHRAHVLAGCLDETAVRHAVSREPGPVEVDRIVLHREDVSADFANHVNPAAAAVFGRMLRRIGPDIVHFHNLAGLSIDMVHHAADLGLPVVMTLHDYWGLCGRNTLVRADGKLCHGPGIGCARCLHIGGETPMPTPVRNRQVEEALRRVSLFLSPSKYLARRFQEWGIAAERIRVLPNGIDLSRFGEPTPTPAGAPLLYLGYLGAHKGTAVLLEALARPQAAAITLQLAGEGHLRAELETLAGRLGLGDRVRFLGRVTPGAVPELLARCGGLVVASTWPENAPLTINEAMAAGRPVVSTNLGGCPELVEDDVTGWLVPPSDPDALADALARLASNPGAARRMGMAARRSVAGLDRSRIVTRLEAIYRELIEAPRPVDLGRDGKIVALDPQAGDWGRPEIVALLEVAEENAGRYAVTFWPAAANGDSRPAADVLLLGEGSLDAAAEGMAHAIPFVGCAPRTGALARLASDSGAGLVSPDPAEAGRMLARLLEEPELYQSKGAQGRRFTERLRGA